MEGVVTERGFGSKMPYRSTSDKPRVLLTGVDGYIGCIISSRLIEDGYDVDGLDTGYYRNGWLYHDGRERPHIICKDTRKVTVDDLYGYDAIVHLAELSNDPLCEFDESSTYDVNFKGSATLAEKAKAAGVKRFIYASSCSVYGAADGAGDMTELSPVNPQTVYARCKVSVEKTLSELNDRNFVTTALRNATAFGASPRMRFDIVLNNLAGLAWTTKCIRMTSDGSPWRPLVHVDDISSAIMEVLAAPEEAVSGEVFNVGSDEQNYRVRDIVETVGEVFEGCSVAIGSNNGDNRSYKVNFDKIRKHLPNFRCKHDVRSGALELRRVFETIKMSEDTFTSPAFTRLKQLKNLLTTEQLDSNLFWRQA